MAADPQIANHVRDVWPGLQELFAAGENVRALRAHPGWADLYRIIDAEITAIDRTLDGAREPLSQADYAMQHGRRHGLLAYVRAADAIVSKADAELERQQKIHEREGDPSLTGG